MRWWSTSIVACALATPARADEPPDDTRVLPCRPTVTCTAELASPGTLEVELGYQLRRGGDAWQHAVPLLVKLPLARWIEAQVGTDYTHTPAASYVDNVTFTAKVHALDQRGPRPALAVSIAASIPMPAQSGYTRTYNVLAVAYASKDYGKLHLDANVGIDALAVDGATQNQPFVALAGSYAITDRLSVAMEPHYFGEALPYATRDAGVIAAVGFTLRPRVVLDAAIDLIASEPQSISAIVGVSVAPVRFWRGR